MDLQQRIDLVLADHDEITEQLGQQYFAEAMASVRDLIDFGADRATSYTYEPSQFDPDTGERIVNRTRYYEDDLTEGLVNVHSVLACQGRVCIVHSPTEHHMRTWPIWWESERSRFERQCVCGNTHPDPDQFWFWEQRGLLRRAEHNCDGCCIAPAPAIWQPVTLP